MFELFELIGVSRHECRFITIVLIASFLAWVFLEIFILSEKDRINEMLHTERVKKAKHKMWEDSQKRKRYNSRG